MRKLVRGILDFHEKLSPEYKDTFARLALGQSPDSLLITCSDSRVAVNVFASTDPGDVFVVRNVGNLIPPCNIHGQSEGCESAAAAVEYAVTNLDVSSIIVCGHSECGAMISIKQNYLNVSSANLRAWLSYGEIAYNKLKNGGIEGLIVDENLSKHNQLSQLNILQQIFHLKSYPVINKRINESKLKIYGWWFDIANADVYSYNELKSKFVIFDNEEANRVLSSLNV